MDIWIISSFGLLQIKLREFPGCLVVRILGFHCRGPGLISGQGTEKLQAVRCGQNLKREGKKKRLAPTKIKLKGLRKQDK